MFKLKKNNYVSKKHENCFICCLDIFSKHAQYKLDMYNVNNDSFNNTHRKISIFHNALLVRNVLRKLGYKANRESYFCRNIDIWTPKIFASKNKILIVFKHFLPAFTRS